MSDELHIDDFCKDVGRTLIFLYDYFPRKMEIYIEDISGPEEADDYGLHSERYLACLSAIVWLAEEGLIRYEALVKQESIDQAVLTKKTFVLLSTLDKRSSINNPENEDPLSVLLSESTHIARLKQSLKSGSSEKLKQSVRTILFLSEDKNDDYTG